MVEEGLVERERLTLIKLRRLKKLSIFCLFENGKNIYQIYMGIT